MGLLDIMDKAINETLSRTLLTSTLTLAVVIVLLIWGGEVIFDFALVLAIGILVGTYSSIYIASPIVYWWQKYVEKPIATTTGGGGDEGGGPSSRRRRRPQRDDDANSKRELAV